MMRSLNVENFTVFENQGFEFAKGLNVIVGQNGTGKTHVLKLSYAVISALGGKGETEAKPTKQNLQPKLAKKLVNVFKPDSLGRLSRRARGVKSTTVSADFEKHDWNTSFQFNTKSESEVKIDQLPKTWLTVTPAYFPTRELLTIFPGFVSLYDGRYLEFDETWRDTCSLLGEPLVRGPREDVTKKLMAPLEQAMGGKIDTDDSGNFYLKKDKGGRIEMHLVSEGLRKLGMLARLIANGTLLDKGVLFWDEPEANLNPRIVQTVAECIVALSRTMQIFVATHSLYLLREFELLLEKENQAARFFGLQFSDDLHESVAVEQSDSLAGIGQIASLEEELLQSDRVLNQEQSA